jgi:hypothetical protein
MLFTSHGAAAVLATAVYKKISQQEKPLTTKTIIKMFLFGVLPDIPLNILVLTKKFDPSIHYHHKWITHTPIFWLAISLLTMKFFSKRLGLALLVSTWLHLGMDWYGGADGIPFLYPFKNDQFGAMLSHVNGPKGLRIYLSNPLFLAFEILVQGTFLAVTLFTIKKEFLTTENS